MAPIFKIEEEIDEFQIRVRDFIDSMFQTSRFPLMIPRHFLPPMDVFETEGEIIVIVDIAGLKQEDIQLSLKGSVLKICGNRSMPVGYYKYHQMEIDYGPFERSLCLPVSVDTKDISATYKNGFLEIRMAKKKKTIKDIQVSE